MLGNLLSLKGTVFKAGDLASVVREAEMNSIKTKTVLCSGEGLKESLERIDCLRDDSYCLMFCSIFITQPLFYLPKPSLLSGSMKTQQDLLVVQYPKQDIPYRGLECKSRKQERYLEYQAIGLGANKQVKG